MAIKVLVVDDSSFFRRQIVKLLSDSKDIIVIDTAVNGLDAVEKATALLPDVITMDIEMPVMNGIDATREILKTHNIPILVFSSLSTEGAQVTLDALQAGAIDFIPKNIEDISKNRAEVTKLLTDKLRNIVNHYQINDDVQTSTEKTFSTSRISSAIVKTTPQLKNISASNFNLLVIGASTGGPIAIQNILKDFPSTFTVPILIVQHMPGSFTRAFAERLNQVCNIDIREATNADKLKPGLAYLAPGGKQMILKQSQNEYVIVIEDGDQSCTYKPSVDVTLNSIVKVYKERVLTIILTGMGSDGCNGAKNLHQTGSEIWVQDQESSVVWGMPAAVIDIDVASKILPLTDIAREVNQVF